MLGVETHVWLSAEKQARPPLDGAAEAEQVANELLEALAERHPELAAHMERAAELATSVALELGLDNGDLWTVGYGARLHDIGKVAVASRILNKPGSLEQTEWASILRHTIVGGRILESTEALRTVAPVVRASHERWDGGGYPDRLAGEQIPLASRIVFTCDSYDAMTSDRPYQPAMSAEEAMAELRRCAGTQFDPRVVEAVEIVLSARDN